MSFSAGTKVLLASGAAVPISQLVPGDKVLATNVKTGKTQAEPVAAVLVHKDTDRYDLRVTTARGTAVIQTTSSHLFWDPASSKWMKAGALRYGTHLRTPSGASVTVLSGSVPADATGWMWDLTITTDHDFYIDIAAAAVLVHNCPGYNPSGGASEYSREEIAQLTYQHVGEGDIAGRPELEEIQSALDNGDPERLGGQNAVKLEYQGVRVIVNDDLPWRSTAYYIR